MTPPFVLFSEPAMQCDPNARSVTKTCEECGASFTCARADQPCWCESVQLSPESRATLRASFLDCLCPACLTAASRGET